MSFCCSRKIEASSRSSETHISNREWLQSMGKGFFGFAAAAVALLSVCSESPALAESLTVAFPVSRAPEVIEYLEPFSVLVVVCCFVFVCFSLV